MAKKRIDNKSHEQRPAAASAVTQPLTAAAFHLLAMAAILVAGTFLYANTLDVPFVLDDITSIAANPLVKNFQLTLKSRIVGDATFALNYALHGFDLPGYHLCNILLHCCSALLVYTLILLTGRTAGAAPTEENPFRLVALISSMLFVIHPVQTQAVTYLAQRVTLLAAFFFLMSLVFYLTGRLANGMAARYASFFAAFAAAMLAMLSKENAATLPLALALLEFIFFRGDTKKRLALLAGFGAATAALFLIVMSGNIASGDLLGELGRLTSDSTTISRSTYLLTQFMVIVTYLRLMILPVGQNLDYDFPLASADRWPQLSGSFLLLALLLATALWCVRYAGKREGNRLYALAGFGILWFFCTLQVESGIIPIRDVIFEHRLYLPSVGLLTAVASLSLIIRQEIAVRSSVGDRFLLPTAAAVMVLLSAATVMRNRVWLDEQTLWEDVVRKSPAKARAHGSLAGVYRNRGMIDDAVREYREAIRLDPRDAAARNNLGTILFSRGEHESALKEYGEALKLAPKNPKIYYNSGDLYLAAGRLSEAEKAFNSALQLAPDYDQAMNNLGIVLGRQGKFTEAAEKFRGALKINPGNSEAGSNLKKIEAALSSGRPVLVK